MAKRCGAEEKMIVRYRITVKGIVQGVGFRPFVYKAARLHGLKGVVSNTTGGVTIEAEGQQGAVRAFLAYLKENKPPLSRVSACEWEVLEPCGYSSFAILPSREGVRKEALIPPDVALCPDCAREVLDPQDRHYGYPFTNCTNCGPRFTIVRGVPYDRAKTSMARFPMCPECAGEYHNPGNRRFHAQPVACPACGPQVELVDRQGRKVEGNWLELSWRFLQDGKILAVKGLGGFHLVCDARNREALKTLRRRKGREAKPLAVMCRLETANKYCFVGPEEEKLLTSPQAPIVILTKRPSCSLPEELGPRMKTLGIMLPYTPLHLMLLNGPLEILVMTSGNCNGLPLAKDNGSALEELKDIADYFLWHNREIINRCDDSVAAVIDGGVQIWRRSRGYVPAPLMVPVSSKPVVLGMGGDMKNTFCLLKGNLAFISQHIGELGSREGEEHFFSSLENLKNLIGSEPEVIGYDLHPGYRSSRLAAEIPAKARFAVQHHHAHMISCLADNGVEEKVIGVILDGTGYGTDGRLWGFEILTGDYADFTREYHLAYVPLPGGEQAVRYPWRTAVAYLMKYLSSKGESIVERLFQGRGEELQVVKHLILTEFNSPLSSSCGRLFDAVSALLGLCYHNSYEGQAAIELGEMILDPGEGKKLAPYPFSIEGKVIHPGGVIAGVVADLERGVAREIIATRFHNTVLAMVREAVRAVAKRTHIKTVALSGGVWQNRYLFSLAKEILPGEGYHLLVHRHVPANDGGLSLGQAMIACRRWQQCA
ncbi:carbamoyltransferase HypF [Moorella sp. Hama-1]|uniref:carbamoyltransferase HypF n=1 Tax=Moorella sp. Hama-1 TaxID=2138101 RepID=UPI000D647AF9|nr:carbamoyltransferase HypF [Moorella sp. Hama-1]BCV20543.1 carbamoyltransferase [Moorella sp. Hama-1]